MLEVHAFTVEIANFKTNSNMPIEKMAIAINSQLKNSIIIKKAEEVDEKDSIADIMQSKKHTDIL